MSTNTQIDFTGLCSYAKANVCVASPNGKDFLSVVVCVHEGGDDKEFVWVSSYQDFQEATAGAIKTLVAQICYWIARAYESVLVSTVENGKDREALLREAQLLSDMGSQMMQYLADKYHVYPPHSLSEFSFDAIRPSGDEIARWATRVDATAKAQIAQKLQTAERFSVLYY